MSGSLVASLTSKRVGVTLMIGPWKMSEGYVRIQQRLHSLTIFLVKLHANHGLIFHEIMVSACAISFLDVLKDC
jgi:hypothetical protein